MVEISDDHVEWAVVNRMKNILEAPSVTKFEVTQSFAVFTTILMWAKNRIWVDGNKTGKVVSLAPSDIASRETRNQLRGERICGPFWHLSRVSPELISVNAKYTARKEQSEINSDFDSMTAEDFFKWLRDAIAHGDGRNIRPIHRRSVKGGKTLLAGFTIVCAKARASGEQLTLTLYHADMKRLGARLADLFCGSLSGDNQYFELDAGTVSIEEAALAS
jgi:hypothetical protein